MPNTSIKLRDANYDFPTQITTKAGYLIEPSLNTWHIAEGSTKVIFKFENFSLSESVLYGFKSTLIWYLENESLIHSRNLYQRFLSFIRHLDRQINRLSSEDILNYRASLGERNQWKLGSIAGLLKRWHAMMLPGIDDDVVSLVSKLRIKGNIKGEAVLTMDPEKGPFTELEIQAIHQSLSDRYKSGRMTSADYCLSWLFISIGMRPIQYADMKVMDILTSSEKDGSEILIARVPEAKKRVLRRELFLERKISGLISYVFVEHIFSVKELLRGKIEELNEAPLFPDICAKKNSKGFDYHASPQKIGRRIKGIINSLQITSERTGKGLFTNATRFRRTLGTRAAEEGHPLLVIAEIMGHKDTQNVGIYIEATPAIIRRIDKAVALKLAPMAQAFKGILINSEADAVRSDDKSSRICGPQQVGDFRPVGSCGSYGFCGSFAPIACYTCQNFQPWADAPHEKVLEHLISERERLLRSSDSRIAAINDQTILAVAQVVSMCKKQLGREDA